MKYDYNWSLMTHFNYSTKLVLWAVIKHFFGWIKTRFYNFQVLHVKTMLTHGELEGLSLYDTGLPYSKIFDCVQIQIEENNV